MLSGNSVEYSEDEEDSGYSTLGPYTEKQLLQGLESRHAVRTECK
jgi:hypothetical protein